MSKVSKLARTYWRAVREFTDRPRTASAILVANIALSLAGLAEPVLFGRIVDSMSDPSKSAGLLPSVVAWVAFGLFVILSATVVALSADRTAQRGRMRMMQRYFEHSIGLPLAWHGDNHSNKLGKVMFEGANAMATMWLDFLRDHLCSALTLLALVPLALSMNPVLGSVLVALVLFFTVTTAKVLGTTKDKQDAVQSEWNRYGERTGDVFANAALIQSFARLRDEAAAVGILADRILTRQLPVLTWWAFVAVATRAASTLSSAAILVIGAALHAKGQASVGEIVSFLAFSGMAIGRLQCLVGFAGSIVGQAPQVANFLEVLDTAPMPERTDSVRLVRAAGRVRFEDVAFSYDGRRTAVDLDLDVPAGKTVAFVGSTGSGKSTTLSLLFRAHDPQSGRILIDGTDIRDMALSSLREQVGVVFQEPFLLARSIADNLRIGKPDATDEELWDACRRAQAYDFVAAHPDGLQATVSERGRTLSGGERQRLSIARAILKDPPILILDEATSALDADTERKVQAAFEELMRGRTTFVIAHRLATVRDADLIVVLHKGRIVEKGSFDELVARNGAFAELARAQYLAPELPEAIAA